MPQEAPPNGGAPPVLFGRVAEMQTKLHRWAAADPGRRFDDLFNRVHDPATLIVAFARVAGNRGANTAGVASATWTLLHPWRAWSPPLWAVCGRTPHHRTTPAVTGQE